MTFITLYFVAYKLHFNVEIPAVVIIITQLTVMAARLFQTHDQTIAQGIITIFGDVLFKMGLYYFVFEMGFVAQKLESKDLMEYKSKKK